MRGRPKNGPRKGGHWFRRTCRRKSVRRPSRSVQMVLLPLGLDEHIRLQESLVGTLERDLASEENARDK